MQKIAYAEFSLSGWKTAIVQQVNDIVADYRAQGYMKIHGDESWELDALDPPIITALIEAAIKPYKNAIRYRGMENREKTEKEQLRKVSERWKEIVDMM